jgi:hypothetical protein
MLLLDSWIVVFKLEAKCRAVLQFRKTNRARARISIGFGRLRKLEQRWNAVVLDE